MACPPGSCDGYELAQDLDFNDPNSYASGSVDRGWSRSEGGEGWFPIGSHFNRFNSALDGNDHTVANLFIDRDADYVGLFGAITLAGSIHRFALVEVDVRGRSRVGPLVGGNGGTIVSCYATGSVSGANVVGGLVGSNDEHSGTIVGSYATGNVSGMGTLGGLAGGNWGMIVGSHATGDVSGTSYVGGLAGYNAGSIGTSYATGNVSGTINVSGTNAFGGLVGSSGGAIISSHATGNVSGGHDYRRAGGLVGENYNTIRGSYATGGVSGTALIGGLVGANFGHSTVLSSYASGAVSGIQSIGGLVGYNDDTSVVIGSYARGGVSGTYNVGGLAGWNLRSNGISVTYWNIETSGQDEGVGGGFISDAKGKTTAELQTPTSYDGIYRNWDTDIDDADGDGYETTGTDDPWDFGTDDQYPVLKADFDGDGEATWEEFGIQRGVSSPPPEMEAPEEVPQVAPTPSCTNGVAVENPQESLGLVSDCKVLVQARDALAGSARLNWSTDIPIARWDGITVDGSPPRVVELQFEIASLSGQIPPQLGNLSALTVLSLHINDLTGGIPPELASLSELRTLNLHGNFLVGAIPPELGNLQKLTTLVLSANRLTSNIPPELNKLSNLEWLDLSQNRLSGNIPQELASLSRLQVLGLDQNDLIGAIPGEIAELSELRRLSLSANRLTGSIPPELGHLSNLRGLNLADNGLTGQIPQDLANLSKLDSLTLRDNQLTGAIPTWLSGSPHFQFLNLGKNQLTGTIPSGLSDLPILALLYLDNNNLTGTIPRELSSLSRLTDLKLNDNQLTGSIPQELASLLKLQVLDLSHNDLTGAIPRDLGNLSNLWALFLDNNQLTGSIPVELADLAKLQILHLNGNYLTGSIPTELTALSRLLELRVIGNDLTGCVPWHLAYKLTLEITHDRLPKCPPPVAEGGMFSVEASRLVDDDTLMIVAVGDAVNGTVSLNGTTITYTHDGSETATDSFTYTAIDGIHSSTVTVTVTVTPVNDPPIAVADAAAVDEGDTLSMEASALLDNDTDAENDTLSITAVGEAVNGTVFLDGTTIIYTHDGSETATDSFTYAVNDGADTDTTRVTITVTPVNDLPVAVGDTAAVDEGDTFSVEASALLDNDTDAEDDTLSITAVGDEVNGTVFLDGTTITYEHDGSETTTGSFSYTVSDGTDSGAAVVTITVTPVNDLPVAVGDTAAVDEGDTLSIEASALLDNDTDAENDTLSVTAVGDAVNGALFLDGTTITYEHDGSETANGSFSYTVTDGTGSAAAVAAITVTPVNDLPVAVGDTAAVDEGGTLSIEASALLHNDTDAENDPLSVTAVGDAVNGAVFLDGTTITYEHDGSETTTGSFSYTVSDGTDTVTTTVTITVAPVGDAAIVADKTPTLPTATPEAEAAASPTPELMGTPATTPTTTPEAPVPPTDDGGMNGG